MADAMSLDAVRDRVRLGAGVLDRVRPGWAGEIDLDRLDMSWGDRDVLGQLYGLYSAGLVEIAPEEAWGDDEVDLEYDCQPVKWAEAHGFTIQGIERRESEVHQWDCLTDAWKDEIRSRRGEGA
jgi:hypothetical protein